MLCWRDLTKKCAEEDCPMWMTGLDFSDFGDGDKIGLDRSRCALAVNEKLGVMRTMVDIIEFVDDLPFPFDDDFDDEEPERIQKAPAPKAGKTRSGKPGRAQTKKPAGRPDQMILQK